MAYRHRIEQARRRRLRRASSQAQIKAAAFSEFEGGSPQVMAMLRGLTIRQRTFLRAYLENGGNGTQSALAAYRCTTVASAEAVARETLKSTRVQGAYQAILAAGGLSDRALRGIHLRYLSLHASPDVREKQLGLTALRLGYKVSGAFAPERLASAADPFAGWTDQELATFAETGRWPARFRDRGISPAEERTTRPGAPADEPVPTPLSGAPTAECPEQPAPFLARPAAPQQSVEPPASPPPTAGSPPTTHPPHAMLPEERTWPPMEPSAPAAGSPLPLSGESLRGVLGEWDALCGRETDAATQQVLDRALLAMATRDRLW